MPFKIQEPRRTILQNQISGCAQCAEGIIVGYDGNLMWRYAHTVTLVNTHRHSRKTDGENVQGKAHDIGPGINECMIDVVFCFSFF